MPSRRISSTAFATCSGKLPGLRAERDRRMRGGLCDADDPRGLEAVEDGRVLGQRDAPHRLVEIVEVDVDRTALEVDQLVARHLEVGAQLDERQHAPLLRLDAVAGRRGEARDAAEVRGRVVEAERPGEVDELARAERRHEVLARLLVEHLPGPLGDGRDGSQEVVHRAPQASDAERASGGRAAAQPGLVLAIAGAGLGGLAVLDDVALHEEHSPGDLTPAGRAPQQELEIHGEMLELLALGVGHDRARLVVRPRPQDAARTSRWPPPPPSATRTGGRTYAPSRAARPEARDTDRSPFTTPCDDSSRTVAP